MLAGNVHLLEHGRCHFGSWSTTRLCIWECSVWSFSGWFGRYYNLKVIAPGSSHIAFWFLSPAKMCPMDTGYRHFNHSVIASYPYTLCLLAVTLLFIHCILYPPMQYLYILPRAEPVERYFPILTVLSLVCKVSDLCSSSFCFPAV